MKVRSSVKKMCKGCKVMKYNQKTYIRCKDNPRHKQRQLFSTAKPIYISTAKPIYISTAKPIYNHLPTYPCPILAEQTTQPAQESNLETRYVTFAEIKDVLV